MSGLSTPPMEDSKSQSVIRRSSKSTKQSSRTSKRTTASHDHAPSVIDGRHKRVWKACERCRMKKTKCDGESPCKRCKDDGLVCTAGSRKKTEFKQLPRGYAEVLENTQYALIATVQKLYTMVRNNESWELGEPDMNERGQPVIHDIAYKLGCIRPSPDLPSSFPEGEEDFAELQAQLQAARSSMNSEDNGSRKLSTDGSSSSPALDRTERASSSESDHSNLSKEYNQMIRNRNAVSHAPRSHLNIAERSSFEQEAVQQARVSLDTARSIPSPIYTDFQMESPMLRNTTPFSPWSAGDEFLGPTHALDLTAHFMRQQQTIPRTSNLNRTANFNTMDQADFLKTMQFSDAMSFSDGTIRPNMLDCNNAMDLYDQMDVVFPTDYEGQLMA